MPATRQGQQPLAVLLLRPLQLLLQPCELLLLLLLTALTQQHQQLL
jgi:hypothetical protein